MRHKSFPEFAAATLAAHATPLAEHWLERAQAATPRAMSPGDQRDDASSHANAEQVVRALAASVRSSTAASLVLAGEHEAARRLLAGAPSDETPSEETPSDAASMDDASVAPVTPDHVPAGASPQDAQPSGEVIRLGWGAGAAAYDAGRSVHHLVRDADLLLAVVLADLERAAAHLPADVQATAADGVAVARLLQRAAGRYTQAAVSGFVHALLAGLRERYRLLRHDLRNPLGTIRSALSLMEDETVPLETRQSPNVRAMVARNAGSLDRLITRRLDDASAAGLLATPQEVHVRDVALAARREVREAARLAGCEVIVDLAEGAPSRIDGAALELTLATLLLAALAQAPPGSRVRVGRVERPGLEAAYVVLRVDLELSSDAAAAPDAPAADAPRWDPHGIELALTLARDYGGRLGLDASVSSSSDDGLAATLVRSPAVYLRLPFVELGGGAPGAETERVSSAPAVPLADVARGVPSGIR